jgi:hypothetical protein
LEISQLLPDEFQSVNFVIGGNTLNSVTAWEKDQGNIDNIFIFEVSFIPHN